MHKCDCVEPYDWDYFNNGIWLCECPKPSTPYKVEEILKEIEENDSKN